MTTRDDGLDGRELKTVAWGTGAIAAFGWVPSTFPPADRVTDMSHLCNSELHFS